MHSLTLFFYTASATAFYKAIPVVEFLAEVIAQNIEQLAHPRSSVSEENRIKFTKEIKS